jgi:shikimate kinase
VPAAAVVGEAVVALAVAEELFAKLGGDSLAELQAALRLAWRRARLLEGHVYLCGLPGSGKSTVGPIVASLLGLPFVDLDVRVETSAGRSVPEIFSAEGEDGFRARESAQVREVSRGPRSVIALGGGAVTARAVRYHVRRSGHLVWLRAPVDLCAGRAAGGRPLLAGDPAGKLTALAKTREPLYARISDAQLDVEGLSPEQVARACAAAVRSLEAERAWS